MMEQELQSSPYDKSIIQEQLSRFDGELINQDEDNNHLFLYLHKEIKISQQKLFTQIWLSLEKEYLQKMKQKQGKASSSQKQALQRAKNDLKDQQIDDLNVNKKLSSIYFQAFDKLHQLDIKLHDKQNKKYKEKLVDFYFQQKEQKYEQELDMKQYIKILRQQFLQLDDFNLKMKEFFKSYGKCLQLQYRRYELTDQQEIINIQCQVFEKNKLNIEKLRKQYYIHVENIYEKVKEFGKHNLQESKRLLTILREVQQNTERQRQELQKINKEQAQMYIKIAKISRRTAERQMRQRENPQMNYKMVKKQAISDKNPENFCDKLYIRPKSQIMFYKGFVSFQQKNPDEIQIPLQTVSNSAVVKGRYQSRLQTQVKANMWIIVLLAILSFVVGVY